MLPRSLFVMLTDPVARNTKPKRVIGWSAALKFGVFYLVPGKVKLNVHVLGTSVHILARRVKTGLTRRNARFQALIA